MTRRDIAEERTLDPRRAHRAPVSTPYLAPLEAARRRCLFCSAEYIACICEHPLQEASIFWEHRQPTARYAVRRPSP